MIECALRVINLRIISLETGAGKRTIISVLAAFAVVVIIYFLVPSNPVKPSGIVLPIGEQMTPVAPESVSLFDAATSPLSYQTIGHVSVILHSTEQTPQGQTALLRFAQRIAGKTGANGIIATFIGHTLSQETPSSQAVYVFRGTAVYYVPNS